MTKTSKLPSTAGQFPEPDLAKREAFVASYFETGNALKSATLVGIHQNTAYAWKNADWFEKAIKELKRSLDRQMDGKITRLLSKTLDGLEQRLEKGDTKIFSTKEGIVTEQVPVTARDLAIVTGVLFDKRAAIRRAPDNDDNSSSALERIAEKLRQYALTDNKDPARDTSTTDVEVKEIPENNEDLV
jgi:hypothetical protein